MAAHHYCVHTIYWSLDTATPRVCFHTFNSIPPLQPDNHPRKFATAMPAHIQSNAAPVCDRGKHRHRQETRFWAFFIWTLLHREIKAKSTRLFHCARKPTHEVNTMNTEVTLRMSIHLAGKGRCVLDPLHPLHAFILDRRKNKCLCYVMAEEYRPQIWSIKAPFIPGEFTRVKTNANEFINLS